MIGPVVLAAALTASAQAPAPIGVWENPKHTIAVKTDSCGATLCGTIVAAAPTAVADAREAGIPQLVGVSLLRDYRKNGPNSWRGLVFIPDMGRTFFSHLTMLSPSEVRISGCILGGLLCKSQVWTRL